MANWILLLIFVLVSFFVHSSLSQPLKATCNGVFLSYNYTGGYPIPPTDPTNQPYRFESTVTVLNNGRDELKSWSVFIGFQNNELLVSANNALLADGRSLPAFVGNGTVLVGSLNTDLKSAIETAGDVTQMEVIIQLVGTRFGNRTGNSDAPLPLGLTLANDGYSCPAPTRQGNYLQYTFFFGGGVVGGRGYCLFPGRIVVIKGTWLEIVELKLARDDNIINLYGCFCFGWVRKKIEDPFVQIMSVVYRKSKLLVRLSSEFA